MNWIAWMLVGLGVIATVLFMTGWWRYVLTGYLIARVTPYEQPGGGAGSILFVGDSTGYGTGASRSADSVAGRLGADYPGYSIKNNSVNQRTIAGARRVIAGLKEAEQYDLVVFQIGANDLLSNVAASEVVNRIQELIDVALPYTDNIVILTCGNVGAVPLFTGTEAQIFQATSAEYTSRMTELVEQYDNVSFVSLYDNPANDPFVSDPKTYTSIDMLHPTSAGYAIWYQKAQPFFDPVLEQR